ncbi:hypothetical protein QE400_001779 [Xanthomonas sacchari]|nr:hypothetical protein [Xanthomonas sacchari]
MRPKRAFDNARQRLTPRAIKQGVIAAGDRVALDGLKWRSTTDPNDQATSGHKTESLPPCYEPTAPIVEPARLLGT